MELQFFTILAALFLLFTGFRWGMLFKERKMKKLFEKQNADADYNILITKVELAPEPLDRQMKYKLTIENQHNEQYGFKRKRFLLTNQKAKPGDYVRFEIIDGGR